MTSSYSRRAAGRLLATLLYLSLAVAASAEPVTAVRNNGPSANRIDIVVLGDGYTAAELASGQWAADVDTMVQGLFAQEPYREYEHYYNVWRVDVASAESGADHSEQVPAVFRNTALDAMYNCAAMPRLICVNTSKVSTIIGNSGIAADARDLVMVLVNDPVYGGSGGSVAVASLHPQTIELVLHETAHTFALLGDEYGGTPSCVGTEPAYPDITVQSSRNSIKWKQWIDPSTTVPTTTSDPTVPGLYVGGNYCDSGYFRATYNSKMRTLGVPFYQVNQEGHVLRIYNFVSPIDSASPAGASVTIGASQLFSVTPTQPRTHALSVVWAVDGVQQVSGTQFTASNLPAGLHTITATVNDPTPWVRSDPSAVLTDVRAWSVNVQTSGPGAFARTSPATGATVQAANVGLAWGVSSGAAAYEYCVDTTNDGACASWLSAGNATSVTLSALNAGTTYYWHVRASSNGSTTYANGGSTSYWVFTTPTGAPGPFSKTAPVSGATGVPTSLSLSWGASSGATSYEYCVDTTNDSVCATWIGTGVATSANPTGLTGGTTYYWQARATNAAGTTYANGAATMFWSMTPQVGNAPGAFARTTPAHAATGVSTSPPLTWARSAGATNYDYCIDTSNDNACTTWVRMGTAQSAGLWGLQPATTYYWQVRASNASATTYAGGAATPYGSFTTRVAAPGAFVKTSPLPNAAAVPVAPLLSWNAASGATSYEYCLDSTNDNACASWVSTGTATSATVSGLSAGTTYYWHARARNSGGTTWAGGSSTGYWAITTQAATSLPGAFAKTSPAGGVTGLPTNVTLSWGASLDATSYDYCVDTTDDGVCASWLSAGAATSVNLTSLVPGTTYYWQVRATNAAGTTYAEGASTSFASFTTQVTAPSAFTKISPAGGATGLPTSVTLSWAASLDATSYDYCVDTTDDGVCASWLSAGSATSVSLAGLAPGTIYYWQVRATNPAGTTHAEGASTSFASFTTQVAAPSAFTKISPAGGASGLPTSVTLSWGASLDATSYDYCVDTTDDGACAPWLNAGSATGVNLTSLIPGTTYYWQVQASGPGGVIAADGAAVAFASFTTQVAAPSAFTKISPAGGATGLPTSVTLSWGASANAVSYEFCVDATNDDLCTSWVSAGAGTSAAIAGLTAGTAYYWQVRATNAGGTTDADNASFAAFSTKVPWPGAFVKTLPSPGQDAQLSTVNLVWGASTAATSYEYCVDTTNDNACATWINVGTSTSVTVSGLNFGTRHYWHVRAVNASGATYAGGSAAAFWAFITKWPPSPFVKVSPMNGATAQLTNPTLSWAASPGATSYEYCVDTTNDGVCTTWMSSGTGTSVALTGLSSATTYYWQVRALNIAGATAANGGAAAFWRFATR